MRRHRDRSLWYYNRVTDTQTVVAAIAGAAGTIAGTIAGAIRWSTRRKTKSNDQATLALIENAKSNAILSTRIESLGRQLQQSDEFTRKDFSVSISRLEAVASEIQTNAVRLHRTAEIMERDARLDDSQRTKLARIRTKIARGLAAHAAHAQAGSSGDGDE